MKASERIYTLAFTCYGAVLFDLGEYLGLLIGLFLYLLLFLVSDFFKEPLHDL